MQNNFNNNPYGGNPNYGYTYGVPHIKAANNTPITKDIADMLSRKGNELDMKIDQMDMYRAICTHKDPTNGSSTLIQNNDGSYTCSICGETFNFFEGTSDDVETHINKVIDMFQTAKTIYLDAPNSFTEQYYQMIPLLKKFKNLWIHAMKNFSKYEDIDNGVVPINNGYNGFNAINTLLSNPYMAQQQMMYPQQFNPAMQQQMMYPQQQFNPAMQQPMNQQPMMMYPQQQMVQPNPMAYGAPAVPMAPQPGVVPNAPVAPQPAPTAPAAPAPQPAPAAPAANNGEVTQQKVFHV